MYSLVRILPFARLLREQVPAFAGAPRAPGGLGAISGPPCS